MFEWRKSVHYWWSYILFSPECKELTSMLDPLLYRWGVPPVVIRCVHWTMQMWVLQAWIKAQGIAIVMEFVFNKRHAKWQTISRDISRQAMISYVYGTGTGKDYIHLKLDTLRPRQDGRHFSDGIFKWIFLNEKKEFRSKFHWSLFLRFQLTIFQHWFININFVANQLFTPWVTEADSKI